MSLDLRLPRRVLDLFSVSTFAIGFASVVGASAGVVMALESSLGELGVFEDECLRWCVRTANGRDDIAISACEVLGRAEHDRHVQVLRRAASLQESDSISTGVLHRSTGQSCVPGVRTLWMMAKCGVGIATVAWCMGSLSTVAEPNWICGNRPSN